MQLFRIFIINSNKRWSCLYYKDSIKHN